MKNLLPLLGIGLAGVYLTNKKSKTKSSSKNKDEIKYEDFPDNVNVKINEENIFKYYSKTPILIKDIPSIYSNLNLNLQVFLDNEKSYIYITPKLAEETWKHAKELLSNYSNQFSGKTIKDADVVTKSILLKFAPDVYWSEGLAPYVYKSAFSYVWISVNWLVRLAYADLNNLSQDFITPIGI